MNRNLIKGQREIDYYMIYIYNIYICSLLFFGAIFYFNFNKRENNDNRLPN